MKNIVKIFLCLFSLILALGCSHVKENNWTQFRGQNSLGIAPESATPPLELNPEKNLAWKIPLLYGLSSPCIFDDRIFLTGFNHSDSALTTYCIDRKAGSLLWQQSVFSDTLEAVHDIGGYTAATPATDGKAVYVYFGSYGVLCYDFDGKLLWDHRLRITKSLWGSQASPIVYDSLLIINRCNMNKPAVLAINCQTGKTEWEHFLDNVPNAPALGNLSWATPVIWRDQLIIHRAFELNSISLKDGSAKWAIGIVTTGTGTPVIVNDTLFINGFLNTGESRLYDIIPAFDTAIKQYDKNQDKLINFSEIPSELAFFKRPEQNINLAEGFDSVAIEFVANSYGIDSNQDRALGREEWNIIKDLQASIIFEHGTVAIKLDGAEGSGKPVILWKEKEYVTEVPSLLVFEGRVFMITNGGLLSCMNTKTGKLVFRERIGAPGAYLASPLCANGYIYLAAYNGKITVIKPGDKLNVIAHSDLKEKIGASPVAIGEILYIRTETGLYAFNK